MKNKLKISIITPCFNSEKTVRDTLESVLKQSYDNYEYIIQDGKSKDKTLEIIKEYEPKFKGRIKVYSEKDKSLFDAMNRGIKHATGDVIGIINSDDVLAHKDVFKKVITEMEKGADVVYSDLMYYNEDLTKVARPFITGEGNVRKGWHPPHPTLYLKRKVYDEVGLFNIDFKISSDLDLMIRILKDNKYKTSYVKDVFVKMRVGGTSTSGLKGYVKNFEDAVRVYKNNNIKFAYIINIKRSIKTINQMLSAKKYNRKNTSN